ncbi:acyl-CoA synthetase [Nocardia bovistercoris]|uniref:Acyl-CoA synthetase n=1 Tax=Nocardia bovistercoris TaxID=2785916 RepID=A0A931N321_9NOCA|nr:acyl-CoA synthetase [Nocardia bovistercoris]MBH0776661.1 acyl-CoA synthetase [Nocardia bovistercoris]
MSHSVCESASSQPPVPGFTLVEAAAATASAVPDRELIIQGDRRVTYAQIADRSRRLAAYLRTRGLGAHVERSELAGHEVGQDLLGIYAYNGNEYLEGILGGLAARVAPFNINYRYVENELRYLLADAGATALLYHSAFAPRVARVSRELPQLRVLIQIADDSGNELLPGAVDYEDAIASVSGAEDLPEPSADDLLVLYTGGTTGMPKAVLWRQHDVFMAACGGRNAISGQEVALSYESLGARSASYPGVKIMILPPLIHGAAQWATLSALSLGQTVVFSGVIDHLDADDVVRTIERERVAVLVVVGDAMARPLLDAIAATRADVSSLVTLASGGATMSPQVKQRWIEAVPGLIVLDAVASSETGVVLNHMSTAAAVSTGTFTAGPTTAVVAEDLGGVLAAGHDGIGWLAVRGNTPLGYKGDAAKTAATFPVIDGTRYAVPGDRARLLADGTVELLGRDAVTINSGGEKIFAEEVELAISSHPAVSDVLVVGRPSDRWGQEVVAIVELVEPDAVRAADLLAHAAESIAGYKLPKAVVICSEIVRSPAGKADYRWARAQAVADSRTELR